MSGDGSGHLLHIVRFSQLEGLVRLPPIHLEDFQVHAMRFDDQTVELQAWRATYSVDISDPSRPTTASREIAFVPGSSSSTTNLGHWAWPEVVEPSGTGTMGECQLVIARVLSRVSGGIEHFTSSELVHRGPTIGRPGIEDSTQLFFGVFFEAID